MPRVIQTLKHALIALKSNPVLFIPKIFLALLWSFFLLEVIKLFIELQKINLQIQAYGAGELNAFIAKTFFLLGIAIALFVVDTIVNATYPLMLKAFYEKKKPSFWHSLSRVLKNSPSIVFPVIAAFLLSIAVIMPFVLLFVQSFASNNSLGQIVFAVLLLAMVFIVSIATFFIYPIAVLEKKGFSSILQSVRSARKNLKPVSVGVLITYALSVSTAFLGVAAGSSSLAGSLLSISSIIIFFGLRIVTVVTSTYSIILNPAIYFEYEKKMKLKGELN
ncbi:MAG: hypothetical protein AB1467_01590 [Candidatus Diapherotrites archaeon]